MGKGKKPFIDRKRAVTFHLVHRSQHDPLIADENAPQHVLVEAQNRNQQQSEAQQKTNEPLDPNKRREEQKKYGINFDDDYDYLQHLKQRDEEVVWEYVENPNHSKKLGEAKAKAAPKLQLPSSVFASEFEEEVGMLNKAAPHPGPRPDWDPDVVAALDEDFDYDNEENILEDDFVLKAMGDEDGEGDDEWLDDVEEGDEEEDDDDKSFDSDDLMNDSDEENEEELMDRLAPLMREKRFADEETKSRFTEYSMSSSVIRRNEQLTLLDDHFEKFYASYDDPELGDLGMEEIEGHWGQKHPIVMSCFKEFKKGKQIEAYNKEWDRLRLEKYRIVPASGEDDPRDEYEELEVEDPNKKAWDCESIISTYSNIYNRPTLIEEPKKNKKNKIAIDPKTGLPINTLRNAENNQLTEKALARLDAGNEPGQATGPKSLCAKSVISTLSVLSIRPKDETPEEKRERKRLLKEYRNERRIERKANAEAFKAEKKRQIQVKMNQRSNQQGAKLV